MAQNGFTQLEAAACSNKSLDNRDRQGTGSLLRGVSQDVPQAGANNADVMRKRPSPLIVTVSQAPAHAASDQAPFSETLRVARRGRCDHERDHRKEGQTSFNEGLRARVLAQGRNMSAPSRDVKYEKKWSEKPRG